MRCAALLLSLLLTPALAPAAEPPPTRASGDLAIHARDILRRYCAECHTGNPDPGQSKLKVMEHGQLTAKGRPVPVVAPGARAQLLELVKDGSMPPANRPGPSADEIAVLEKWVQAQAPAYPTAFDERFTLEAVADDIDRANAKGNDRNAGLSLRYASFAHLVRDDRPLPDLVAAERRLNDALSAATGAPVRLEPVDATATLYRIELTKLGWRTGELFQKMERLKPVAPFALRPFDLLLLEYPHATLRLADGSAPTKRLDAFLAAGNQVRPVPFVRGDWLTAALVRGEKPTPLAADIKSLAALERAMPDGPPVPRQLGGAEPLVIPKPADGRTPIPPLSGWYAGDVTPDPAPFALTTELVADGRPVKSVKVDQAFKLKVRSDRRVFVTLLLVQSDGAVRVQEIDGGSVIQTDASRELAPAADGFRIASIITGGDSATEYFVLFASEVELPLPTVVRSRHDDRPVWRFLLEPSAKDAFDPNKVVRKVIPIPVTKK